MPSKKDDEIYNPQAVQTHLGILQSTIERMAANSASAKAWSITLVSAILVIVTDKHQPRFVWLALIPTLLFLGLDAYYLALEKGFRKSYRAFVEKLHKHTVEESDLYSVDPSGRFLRLFLSAIGSLSVWPFYITLIAMIYLAKQLVV